MVADLVANGDLDLLDQVVAVAAHLLEVALEQHDPGQVPLLRRDLGLGARDADVDAEDLRRDVLVGHQLPRGPVLHQDRHVLDVLPDRARQVVDGVAGRRPEDRVVHLPRDRVAIRVEGVRAVEGAGRILGSSEALLDEAQVVDGVGGLRVHRHGGVEAALGLLEATDLEEDLPLEGAIDGHLARGLERAPDQEEGPLQVVEVEDRLGLQVVDLGLGAAIQARQLAATRQQLVAERHGLLELGQVLDQQLGAVQVRRHELGIRADGLRELVVGLVDLRLVPEDLAAAVVRLGSVRVGAQRLVEPGQGFVGTPAVRRLHRLVETIPVAILVLHGPFRPSGG